MPSRHPLLQLIRDLKTYIDVEPKPAVPKEKIEPLPTPPLTKSTPIQASSPPVIKTEKPIPPVKKPSLPSSVPSPSQPFFSLEPKKGAFLPPDMRWKDVFAKVAPSVVQISTPPSTHSQQKISLLFLHSSKAQKEIDFLESVSNALEGIGVRVRLTYLAKETQEISHLLSEVSGIIVAGHLLSSASQSDLPPHCLLEEPLFYIDNPVHKRALWNQLKIFVKQIHLIDDTP